ncbi:MAG: hypothetical protein MRY49_02480 [Candidatus Pacebacteria bacterium]|nr:hypothetical protein [Candidatus Paceibacterota bacterium]
MDKKLPKTDVSIRPLRTYEGDIAETVEKQKESSISISVKEQKKRGAEKVTKEEKSSSMLIWAVLFIFLGMIAVGFYFWQTRAVTPERKIIETILVYDDSVKKRVEGKSDFTNFLKNQNFEGDILNIELEQDNPQNFVSSIGARTPGSLLRSMTGDMMFGLVKVSGENVPFWIVEVDSYEGAFSGILLWERLIAEDLSSLFGKEYIPDDPNFQDIISENRDLRILHDESGEEILTYTFLDKNTLLITKTNDSFKKLLPLFISSKQIR